MSETTREYGLSREYPWSPIYSSKQVILFCLKAQRDEWERRAILAGATGNYAHEAEAKLWIRSIEREIVNQELVEVLS